MMWYNNTLQLKSQQAFTEQNRNAALEAAEHGQRVFPVNVSRNPDNPKKKKVNIPVKWMKEATTDAKQINSWWDKHPDAAPGMVTGDYLVVDLDDRDGKDGSAAYSALGLDPEHALFAVETPSGGQHLYYNNNGQLTNSQDDIAPGIDTRGVGGFVFAPNAKTEFGDYRLKRGDLARPLKDALDRAASERKAITILTTTKDTPWTSDGFRTTWGKVVAKAKVTGLTFHDLRGTAVTRLALADCSEAEIATITGHSLKDVGAILDAHYLSRDSRLAESAMAKREL